MFQKNKMIGMMGVAALLVMSVVLIISADGIEAESEFTIDGIKYEVIGENEVSVKGCTGANREVVIPEKVYDGNTEYVVTAISDNAFKNYKGITCFSLPDTLVSIGGSAFQSCEGIRSIEIPDGVTTIGASAFEGCKLMSIAYLSSELTAIGDRAFFGCTVLYSIKVPDKVTTIGVSAFEKCTSLYDLELSDGLTEIGNRAFFSCIELKYVDIPGTVTVIGDSVFEECNSLMGVGLSEGLMEIGDRAFYKSTLGHIEIPDTVTSIGKGAFESCIKLKTVRLSENLTEISDRTFYRCMPLTSIKIPDTVTRIGSEAFYYCTMLTDVYLSKNLQKIGSDAFYKCRIISLFIPSSVETIDDSAFNECNSFAVCIGPEETLKSISDAKKPLKVNFDGNEYIKVRHHINTVILEIGSPGDTYEVEITAGGETKKVTGSGNVWSFEKGTDLLMDLEVVNVSNYIVTVNCTDGDVIGAGTYGHGQAVKLTAFPSDGYEFIGWFEYGNKVHESPEYMFTADRDRMLTALFEKRSYTVTVNEYPDMGVTAGSGTYLYGDMVTMEAFPEEGYEFEGWFVGSEFRSPENPYAFTIEEDMSFSALFTVFGYDVMIYVENGKPNENYVRIVPGETVTFTITMDEGFFVHDAAVIYGEASLAFDGDDVLVHDIASDCYIGIYAAPEEYNVLVKTASGEPRGTFRYVLNGFVFLDEDNIFMLTDGDDLLIEAIPEEGFRFVEWSGHYSGCESEVLIDVCSNMTLSASFEAINPSDVGDNGTGLLYLVPVIIAAVTVLVLWRDP